MFSNREMPELGGEAREITAYFTDIQSFSTFSEKLTAPQLVELLNEYLSVMTDILIEEKGTLDKYEVKMQRAGIELREKWAQERQLPDEPDRNTKNFPEEQWPKGEKWPRVVHNMRTRIGVNSGEIVVGNMG
ncbi:adenylate/guanylate cyclase domain-containing protein, partial [Aduncisulcus paluster]